MGAVMAAAVFGSVFVTAGCARKCERQAELLVECRGMDGDQSLEAMCDGGAISDEVFECAQASDDCEELHTCITNRGVTRRANEIGRRLKGGKAVEAFTECVGAFTTYPGHSGLQEVCAQAARAAAEKLARLGDVTDVFEVCGTGWVRADEALVKPCAGAVVEATRSATAKLLKTAPEDSLDPCERSLRLMPMHGSLMTSCRGAAKGLLAKVLSNAPARRAVIAKTCQRPWVRQDVALTKLCTTKFADELGELARLGHYVELKGACVDEFGRRAGAGLVACGQVLTATVATLTQRIVGWRDGSDPTPTSGTLWTGCANLRKLSKLLGDSQKEAAARLCAQAEAGRRAVAARKAVERALAAPEKVLKPGLGAIPWECDKAIEALHELVPGVWQKAALKRVLQRCYVDFGAKHLARVVPRMRYCRYSVKQVLTSVKRYKLSADTLDRWVARAAAKCPSER